MQELPKAYDPHLVEEAIYRRWLDKGYFHAEPDPAKHPFTIVIPPPNITDILHIGHALNNTLQDVIIRWKRMQGYNACWLPGTDHAGIATQWMVEKMLAREGKTRHDLGRDKFVELAWDWKRKHGGAIIGQLKRIGCSCDWQRERFTMDPGMSAAVREVFVQLHEKGLIYKGKRIVNWCPRCHSAISDEEVDYKDLTGNLWHIKYPVKGTDQFVTVATTRPETMLGDTAVAIHPDDERFKHLIGKTIVLPLMGREIPVIADAYVDPAFGTGCVKVTPAHDPNDFAMGRRHDLPQVEVIGPDGAMTKEAGVYASLDRFAARKRVVADLEARELLELTEDHFHAVGHCDRCKTVLEPALSLQWFVNMKSLAAPGIEAVKDGTVKFHPEHWSKTYLHWMENIQDWCISRQLWWGHRFPVWYCECGEMIVSRTDPAECPKCRSKSIRQEEDVLDTWFSSWLWPFSTFGWPAPEQSRLLGVPEATLAADLAYFYPTHFLSTASEIIFLWVARMVMAGLEFRGTVPFSDVMIHGTVRDTKGVKMSKSLGNGIDPVDVIAQYGTDALRASLVLAAPEGQDPHMAMNAFESGRNFANKIWNASRFAMLSLEGTPAGGVLPPAGELNPADRWILSRLQRTTAATNQSLDEFKTNQALKGLYDFFWHDLCDWYLELSKVTLNAGSDEEKHKTRRTLAHVLRASLKLLHPFMPFVTEEIWSSLTEGHEGDIIVAPYPVSDRSYIDDQVESEIALLQEIITIIRTIRGEMNIPPARMIGCVVKGPEPARIAELAPFIQSLGRVETVSFSADAAKPPQSASGVVQGYEIYVPLAGLIDVAKERERLDKEIAALEKSIGNIAAKLADAGFAAKAPAQVIAKENGRLGEYRDRLAKFRSQLQSLQ